MPDFEKELLSIIEEREIVLFEIERVLFTKRYKLSQKHFEILVVQSISMMYAIWEGFIQRAFQLYIAELNKKGIEFQNFRGEIIIFHMENTFKQLREYPEKEGKKVKLYSGLGTFFSSKYHSLYPQINTKDNVGFEVLNKLLKSFCLKPFEIHWKDLKVAIPKYDICNDSVTKSDFLDSDKMLNFVAKSDSASTRQSLTPKLAPSDSNPNLKYSLTIFLRYRNGVAHGGDISSEEEINRKVYQKYKQLVVDLMYEIRERMITGLQNRTYLKTSDVK